MLQSGLGHVEVSVNICLERSVPLFFRNVVKTFLVLLKGGVVDQDVELSKLLYRLRDKLLADFRIADIARQRDRTLTFRFYCAFGFLRILLLFFQKGERDIRAFTRKQNRDCSSD